ncbi:MAG: hypothetical protein H6738_18530 [Alphaproteobacteria bacterium]|nr:hypothetical protein [Alphaproteobacteria bacterium]
MADTVAITGVGAICGCGDGFAALEEALLHGRTGLRPVRRLDVSFAPGDVAGEVEEDLEPDVERCHALAIRTAREAWTLAGAPSGRLVLVVGTSAAAHGAEDLTEDEERADPVAAAVRKAGVTHNAVADAVAAALGLDVPRITCTSACTSGNVALAVAHDLIRDGEADVVLVGGADALSVRRYAGFAALGAVAPGACAPFSEPMGMNLGEGACFLVLEPARAARDRALATLLGWGASTDGHHATAPDPTGAGLARALRAALDQGGLRPDEVDWYDAHATGTELNDAAEWRAVEAVFGDGGGGVAISAPKSFLGHCFGAAGTLEAAAGLVALAHQAVPPTLGFRGPRATGPSDPIPDPVARPRAVRAVLSNNSAFGGANTAVLLAGPERASPARSSRSVHVHATGAVGAHGERELVALLREGRPLAEGVARAVARPSRATRVDVRRLDPVSAFWTLAAARALGEGTTRGDAGDRVAQVGGTSRRAYTAAHGFRRSWETRGPGGVSTQAFSRTVMNAPLGDAAELLGLRGPQELWATGVGAGLWAVARAAELVRSGVAERAVAGGFDECEPHRTCLDPEHPYEPRAMDGAFWGEGAAVVVLGSAPSEVRVAAKALAVDVETAVTEVLGRSGAVPRAVFGTDLGPAGRALTRERADRLGAACFDSPSRVLGASEGATSAFALLWAVAELPELDRSADGVRRALLWATDPRAGAMALVLEEA